MIPVREQRDTIDQRKPRASGDDPQAPIRFPAHLM